MAEKRYLVRISFGLLGLSFCLVVLKALPNLQHAGIPAIVVGFVIFKFGTSWGRIADGSEDQRRRRAIRGTERSVWRRFWTSSMRSTSSSMM